MSTSVAGSSPMRSIFLLGYEISRGKHYRNKITQRLVMFLPALLVA